MEMTVDELIERQVSMRDVKLLGVQTIKPQHDVWKELHGNASIYIFSLRKGKEIVYFSVLEEKQPSLHEAVKTALQQSNPFNIQTQGLKILLKRSYSKVVEGLSVEKEEDEEKATPELTAVAV